MRSRVWNSPWSPTWVSGAQELGLFSATFPSTLAGSTIWNRAARTPSWCSDAGYQCPILGLICHTTVPAFVFYLFIYLIFTFSQSIHTLKCIYFPTPWWIFRNWIYLCKPCPSREPKCSSVQVPSGCHPLCFRERKLLYCYCYYFCLVTTRATHRRHIRPQGRCSTLSFSFAFTSMFPGRGFQSCRLL